jgi:predicted molibdopterin-dependent oxidoreductase YjgC
VVSYPDRKAVEAALDGVDFLVVQDLFLTETASRADVVLPACSFAEKEGTFTSLGRIVQKVNRAITPVAGSKTDLAIFASLFKTLSGREGYGTPAAAFGAITSACPSYAGLEYGALTAEGALLPVKGSVRLVPVATEVSAPEPGKFALLTGSALHHCGTLSLYGEGPLSVSPAGYLEIGREDAAALGLLEGDVAKLASATGEVKLPVRVSGRIAAGRHSPRTTLPRLPSTASRVANR